MSIDVEKIDISQSLDLETSTEQNSKNVIDPWTVEGVIDYNYLIEKFGVDTIKPDLITKFELITKQKIHPWIARNLFFCHRSLDKFLDVYASGAPVWLYTGRGPTSDSMHLGHLIPFMMIKWLQDVFDCVVVIQMADDEKYYFKDLDFETVDKYRIENSKDIMACGFNPKKTFIFSNREYRLNCPQYELFVSKLKKYATVKDLKKIFGFEDANSNVGMLDWVFYQTACAFSDAFPHIFNNKKSYCLVTYAIDQDVYFRMGRDIAPKLKLIKPCSLISKFIPPLTGVTGKMSSSDVLAKKATIFLSDDVKSITKKIKQYAFSGAGGNGSSEDHIKYGGNIATDISYNYLLYFEMDDAKLDEIKKEFIAGKINCSSMKTFVTEKIVDIIKKHQDARTAITDELFNDFYSLKPLLAHR
jgi:tryptophanyl-tRNA synthetase